MSELIKRNETDVLITMVRLRITTGVVVAFLAILLTGTLLISVSSAGNFKVSQDPIIPDIWVWGINGRPNASEAFSVWANVTAHVNDTGIRNVTINISGPNVTIHDLMIFNGSYYEASMDAFPNPGEFRLYVSATGMNNLTRDGRIITVIIEENVEPTVDPMRTLPIVIATSLLLVVIMIMVAMMYDRKQNEIGETAIQSGQET
ncbi:MAG: hypothetical protein ACTSU3_10400 [Candidatus Thorarchaeota archaeon]